MKRVIDVYTVEQVRNRKAAVFMVAGMIILTVVTAGAAAMDYVTGDMALRIVMSLGALSFFGLRLMNLIGERKLSPIGHIIAIVGGIGMAAAAFGSSNVQLVGLGVASVAVLMMSIARKGRGFNA